MPLTAFQREVARILASNRSPCSHVAGGAVINRGDATLRFSDDLDIFHDSLEALEASVAADESSLESAGLIVEWTSRTGYLYRANVSRGDDRLRLDWAQDAAFRFFPAQPDPDFGYCLHRADLATNKVLALAGRGEVRDYLDILELDRDYLSLGALAWAACGKDPGLTPQLILQESNRHSRYREEDLAAANLARDVNLKELKLRWIEARNRAESLFERLPEEDIGCLYVDGSGSLVTPDPDASDFESLVRITGRNYRVFPKVTE